MEPKIYTLKNGLRVVLVDTKTFPSLTTLLLVGAGSRYENKENNGIAHFFEHMAFKGSRKYPNTMILSSTIEGFGGEFNAFTGKDHTGYWIKAPTQHFETVVDVLSDMVQYPLLKEDEIEREKGVIVEEINMYEDLPQRKVGEIFENILYKNNPLGMDVIGSKKTVSNFNRQTFLDYIGNLYHPKNAILIIAGGGLSRIKNSSNIIEEKFRDWTNGVKSTFQKVQEEQSEPQMVLKRKKTEQAHFVLGFRAFSTLDKRKYPLALLAAVLGGGMSSRLFYEVRERRGLCYYISTGNEFYQDVGNLYTQAGVGIQIDKLSQAVEVILKEHKAIIKGDLKPDELKKAKELLKGRIILSLEDSYNVAHFFGKKQLIEESIETPTELIKKIDAVTKEEITELASKIFVPQRLNFAFVGPFEDKDVEKVKSLLTV